MMINAAIVASADQERAVAVAEVRPEVAEEAGADRGVLLRHGNRGRVADDLVDTAEDELAGQRHDERRDADEGDPEALPGADEGTDGEAEDDRGPHREVPDRHRLRDDDADDRRDRTDGQVDVAGDDDHDHAERQDQDVRVLQEQVDHVGGLEDQALRRDREEDQDRDERDDHAVLADAVALAEEQFQVVHEALAPFRAEVMLRMSDSGSAWSAGRSAVI